MSGKKETQGGDGAGGAITPMQKLEGSLIWFSLGIVVSTVIATAGAIIWIEGRIQEITPGAVASAIRNDPVLAPVVLGVQTTAIEQFVAAEAQALIASNLSVQAAEGERQAISRLSRIDDLLRRAEGIALPAGADQSQNHAVAEELLFGAVVAFTSEQCPEGWSRFSEAVGRTIIGSGVSNNLDEEGRPLSPRAYGAVGGEERVTLSINEIPAHSHLLPTDGLPINRNQQSLTRSDNSDEGIADGSASSGETGGGASHNNMPPYIALHYCEKVGG